MEPHIRGFAEFERWGGKKVLEIGCGVGTDAVAFALEGAEYTGVELSPVSLSIAKRRFQVYGVGGRFYEGNAEDLLSFLPRETYDLVYAFGVLHHTPSPEAVIRRVRELMSPQSEFRLMVYSKYSWKNLLIHLGLAQSEAQRGCPLARTYSYADVRSLLRGFEILDVHKDHIFPYKVSKYVQYQYEVVPWFRYMPRPMFRMMKRYAGWHTLIRCRRTA